MATLLYNRTITPLARRRMRQAVRVAAQLVVAPLAPQLAAYYWHRAAQGSLPYYGAGTTLRSRMAYLVRGSGWRTGLHATQCAAYALRALG